MSATHPHNRGKLTRGQNQDRTVRAESLAGRTFCETMTKLGNCTKKAFANWSLRTYFANKTFARRKISISNSLKIPWICPINPFYIRYKIRSRLKKSLFSFENTFVKFDFSFLPGRNFRKKGQLFFSQIFTNSFTE